MSNIALQIELQSAGMVTVGGNVLFDSIVSSDGNIAYDSSTGVITFNETGRYVINWWVTTQASASANGIVFALSSSQGDFLVGNSPNKTGEVYGAGIVTVTAAPVTLSLVNSSTATFYYPVQVPLKAALIVTEDDVMSNTTMTCFAVNQLTHILSQMIAAYPATTWSVFSSSLSSYSGTPVDLYTSPNATEPGMLRLVDVNNAYEALPIANITAVYPGDGTVYDPAFTYLIPPDPLPPGCDTDMIAAIQSYLPLGTDVDIRLGPAISATGEVYRNEYGVLVLSDADGNTPVFLATPHILRIYTSDDPTLGLTKKSSGTKPSISIDKE
jgi:hypothetical protein